MFWNWPSVGLCVFRENCVIISYCQTHTFWSGRFWFLINIIAVCSSLSFNEFFMNRFQFPISHITKLSPLCFTIWRHSIDSFIFCSCCDWFNKIKLKSADEKNIILIKSRKNITRLCRWNQQHLLWNICNSTNGYWKLKDIRVTFLETVLWKRVY